MKLWVNENYSFLPDYELVDLSSASGTVFKELTESIKQEKINRPQLTLIQVVDSINWENIFTHKIHLTVCPHGDNFLVATLDGAEYEIQELSKLSKLITKLLTATYYKTKLIETKKDSLTSQQQEIISTYPQYARHGQSFGTFAVRLPAGGFLTSTRGKKQGLRSISFVQEVDHNTLTVQADTKATLNAPLLDQVLKLNPHLNYLLHGHELIGKIVHSEYEFAGTTGDLNFATNMKSGAMILLPYHGFLVGFATFKEVQNFIKEQVWNNYRAQFPSRYFQSGPFDEELNKHLQGKQGQYLKVLDIGGGELGTTILNQENLEVYYLDPFVKIPPKWTKGRVDWDTNEKFDLIVARGCVNYFTPPQLEKIPLLLNKGGTFMANTFEKAPGHEWQEKTVENLSGIKGIERSRLVVNQVEHQIVFPDYQVNHFFYYYSIMDYFKYFKVLGYKKYGKNSLIIKVMN